MKRKDPDGKASESIKPSCIFICKSGDRPNPEGLQKAKGSLKEKNTIGPEVPRSRKAMNWRALCNQMGLQVKRKVPE